MRWAWQWCWVSPDHVIVWGVTSQSVGSGNPWEDHGLCHTKTGMWDDDVVSTTHPGRGNGGCLEKMTRQDGHRFPSQGPFLRVWSWRPSGYWVNSVVVYCPSCPLRLWIFPTRSSPLCCCLPEADKALGKRMWYADCWLIPNEVFVSCFGQSFLGGEHVNLLSFCSGGHL